MNYTYTYDDIQIIPKYSEVSSRSECSLKTRFTKRYTLDMPIVTSPMDTVTDSEMAIAIGKMGGIGVLHRFMSIDAQVDSASDILQSSVMPCAAIGATGDYKERAEALVSIGVKILLIDVAHGNTKQVKDTIKWCKENLPSDVDVIAGNIATREGARNLAEWGADAIRVGIGNGCFTPDMLVKTTNGLKRIVEVQIGDSVYTHTGEIHQVVNKFEYDKDEEIVIVNGIESTSNHEFYVVHISDVDKVDENTIHQYAKWIPSGELTDEYFLIELE
jgi:IMP dehydrogenase